MSAHPIPAAALDQPLCIVGTVGSGKTYAAKSAVERLLQEGRRVLIIDPTGVWYGLRTRADGSPGFQVVIFGGDHADVPVAPDDGERLGRLLAEDRVLQAIVDVSEMTGGERTRFLTSLLEALYAGKRVPRHLILDEADEMAPQDPLPETRRLQGIVDRIVRRGRVRGFRPMMITQRPAVIHKNVLSQVATLVMLRLTSPQDRKAVEGWVKGSADLDAAKAVLASLPALDVGEGWVWAPREGVLARERFPTIATLDTSATPDADAPPARAGTMAAVDVAAIRAALTVPVETSPGKQRRLPGEEVGQASAAALAEAEEGGYARGLRDSAAWFGPRLQAVADQVRTLGAAIDAEISAVTAQWHGEQRPPAAVAAPPSPPTRPASGSARPAASPARAAAPTASGDAPHPLNSAARKLLAVLDTNPPVRRSWRQVATLAGLKARGGHFSTGRKQLLDAGLVVEEGELVRIAAPSATAGPEAIDTVALVEMWAGGLSGAAPRILRHLYVLKSDTRAGIADALSLQPRGGHWNAAWKELRDNGLIVERGEVVRLAEIFGGSSS